MQRHIEKVDDWQPHFNERNGKFYINIYYKDSLVNVIGSTKTLEGTYGLWLKYARQAKVRLWHEKTNTWNKWDRVKKEFVVCDFDPACPPSKT